VRLKHGRLNVLYYRGALPRRLHLLVALDERADGRQDQLFNRPRLRLLLLKVQDVFLYPFADLHQMEWGSLLLDLADRPDDVGELGLERGAADEEAVDVGALGQLAAVLGVDGAAVLDAGLVGDLLAHALLEPLSQLGVDLLGLGRGSDDARADGPNGLVGDDDVGPLLFSEDGLEGAELSAGDVLDLAGVALFERLADAEDHAEPVFDSALRLLSADLVSLAHGPALGVADNDVLQPEVDKHLGRDLARVGALAVDVAVLARDADVGPRELVVDELQVEGGRGHEDLDAVVLDALQDVAVSLKELEVTVALEVTANYGNPRRNLS